MSLKIRSSRNAKIVGLFSIAGVSTFAGCGSDPAPPAAPIPMGGQTNTGGSGGGYVPMPMAGTGGSTTPTPTAGTGGASGGTGGASGGTGGASGGAGGKASGGSGGTPVVGLPPVDCSDNAVAKEPLPVVVTEAGFIVSGYYETSATEFMQVNEACPDRPAGAQGTCLVFEFTPDIRTWAGVLFQYPANNWGGPTGGPGLCIEEGATKVIFSARGEAGGEAVGFGAAGVDAPKGLTLTTEWQDFELDISAVDYNTDLNTKGGVNGGFSVVMTSAGKIFVDNIQWTNDDVGVGGAGGGGNAGGSGGAP